MFVRNVYCADLDFFLKEILLFMWVLSVPSKDFLLEKRSLKFAACYLGCIFAFLITAQYLINVQDVKFRTRSKVGNFTKIRIYKLTVSNKRTDFLL